MYIGQKKIKFQKGDKILGDFTHFFVLRTLDGSKAILRR